MFIAQLISRPLGAGSSVKGASRVALLPGFNKPVRKGHFTISVLALVA